MTKGIGPNGLGSPNKMGHMGKSAAKIMKKSPSEYGRRHDRLVKRSNELAQEGLEEQYGRSVFTSAEIGAAKGKKIDKAEKLSNRATRIRNRKNSK